MSNGNDHEASLFLDRNSRSLSDKKLREAINTHLKSFVLQRSTSRNFITNFIIDQFNNELVIDSSKIISSANIPIDDPEINRAFQVAIISNLSFLSHEYGLQKVELENIIANSWKICMKHYSYFNDNNEIHSDKLVNYLLKFGDLKNGQLILKKPVLLYFITQNTEFEKKTKMIFDEIKSSMNMVNPPVFLYNKLRNMEISLFQMQQLLQNSDGTEFVYTRGRKERLIYNKIEEMVLLSENCFRLMMAYMSEDTKILYGLIDKLKRIKNYHVRLIVRYEKEQDYNNQNMAAINDLKEAISKVSNDDQRDDMLRRLQIKYFKADPINYYQLHAKMFICDDKSILAGSANLIPTSLESNVEVGFYSEETHLVRDGIDFFEEVWDQCY